MSYNADLYPMNSLAEEPNLRGSNPLVQHLVDFSQALTSGAADIDDIISPILAADVLGITLYMKSGDVATDVTNVKAVAEGSSGSGYLKVSLASSLTSSTATKVGVMAILGRLSPQVVS